MACAHRSSDRRISKGSREPPGGRASLCSRSKDPADDNIREGQKHRPRGEGTVKETVRKPSGNDTLRSNGKADQMKSDLKQAGKKVKDANNN
jgi:uncharacterized protein YjbJ (UPF0337 family)